MQGGKRFLYNCTFRRAFNKISDHLTSMNGADGHMLSNNYSFWLFCQRTKTRIILLVYLISEQAESSLGD